MNKRNIPLSVPNLSGNELEYVTNAVETGWVSTSGPYVDQFEQQVAAYVKSNGAVSCQNGTAGLHIALKLCGVTQADEVIVPALTFIAAVNPVKYLGAEPVFMDCDDSLILDIEKLAKFCENECLFTENRLINKQTKKQIKAIIIVHVFGNLADMEALMVIANKFNLKVIEDATEAIGSYYLNGIYKDKFAGTIGDVGVYSFNGNKIITTGGGGMIVSNDIELLKEAKHLTTQAKIDELYYTHDEVGYNYRMTNLQAALGLAQLEQLETFILAKKTNYEYYKQNIQGIEGLSMLDFKETIRPNYWFYSLYIDENYSLNKDELIKSLFTRGVQARPIWGLINDQKPYESNQTYKIEKARLYQKHILNIPCSSSLTLSDVDYVLSCLRHPEKA